MGTPYVARFFPPERRGFAMGFFGGFTALSLWIPQYLPVAGYISEVRRTPIAGAQA